VHANDECVFLQAPSVLLDFTAVVDGGLPALLPLSAAATPALHGASCRPPRLVFVARRRGGPPGGCSSARHARRRRRRRRRILLLCRRTHPLQRSRGGLLVRPRHIYSAHAHHSPVCSHCWSLAWRITVMLEFSSRSDQAEQKQPYSPENHTT
jgi:hypothetical protein